MKVVVTTHDESAWVLPLTWHFIEKFWPDCPWPIDLLGGPGTPGAGDRAVYRGDDSSWASLTLEYLGTLGTERHILILLDDMIISGPINQEIIARCFDVIRNNDDVQLMRLNPWPGPMLEWPHDPGIGRFDKENAPYLSSLTPTFWRIEYLKRLLRPGESPWQIEVAGTERARSLPGVFLGALKAWMPCLNLLRHGVIQKAALKEVQDKW